MPAPEEDLKPLDGRAARPSGRRTSRLAWVSLLFGVTALCPLTALAAVVTGVWARMQVRRSGGTLRGLTPALLGAALGCVGLGTLLVSALRGAALYREVTPLARQYFTLAGAGRVEETYDLFSPDYRRQCDRARHIARTKRLVYSEEFRSLRWGYRLSPFTYWPASDRLWLTYEVQFANLRLRYLFELVCTQSGWFIDDVRFAD